LVLPANQLAEHLDLLVKHGISAVRTTRARRSGGWMGWWRAAGSRPAQPQALRWGLWEFDGSLSLVQQGLRRTLKAISSAAAAGGLAHVAVDLDRLADQGPAGWKLLDRMLAHVVRLREQKAIDQQTISGVVAHLARTRQTAPARSILRPAA
jgi:HPt (histidine-containing phosphotransfer) domain-containing protein